MTKIHLWKACLSSTPIDFPARNALDRLDEGVAQPLCEFMEWDEVVAFLPINERTREGGTWPDIAKSLVGVGGQRRACWPDGGQELEKRFPE